MSTWPTWHTAVVQAEGIGRFEAMVSSEVREDFAEARFARPAAEQIVTAVHYASENGEEGTGEDMNWDPADGNAIVVVDYSLGEAFGTTLRPDAEGMWRIRLNRPWRLVPEAWESRAQAIAALASTPRFTTLSLVRRRTIARLERTDPRSEPGRWTEAYEEWKRAERGFLRALLEHNVPIGHLASVAREVFDATSAALPHTGLIVSLPAFEVTGLEYLPGDRGAYLATVCRAGRRAGMLSCGGDGQAVEFIPDPAFGHPHETGRQMTAFMDAACDPTGRLRQFEPEQFFHLLLDEHELAARAREFPAEGARTLLRLDLGGDVIYMTLHIPPSQMQPKVLINSGSGPRAGALQHGTRGEYWYGTHWRPVTFSIS